MYSFKNPPIRKSITLPNPRFCSGPNVQYTVFRGFVLDHKTRDFKVVRIAYLRGANCDDIVPPEVEVYKLSTVLWKIVNSKGFNYKMVIDNPSVYLNGAIHWVSYSENEGEEITNSLLVFNLSDETVSYTGLPLVQSHVCSVELSLTLCGEHISVIFKPRLHREIGPLHDSCDVWLMNQYGKPESWMTKFFVDLNGGIENAIGFTRNGEFLVEQYPGDLSSYDPRERGIVRSWYLW
ncbi:hypothetical protein HAX54_000698 [Datura stramonium]|uniref:F-box associated beta-propeller type 1 domain-containing protein n=1 Tax=Datura stramonium TaxID=4076 RepID=A0ABS8T2G9_DATST|nr:hypothetical protein [Datura stramonium]